MPVVVGDALALEVRAAFVPADLVFIRRAAAFVAPYTLTLRVLDGRGRDEVARRVIADTLRVEAFEATGSVEPVVRTAAFANRNEGVAEATLERGDGRAPAVVRAAVPEPAGEMTLTTLGLAGLTDGERRPMVGTHLPQRWRRDTLWVETVAVGAPDGARVAVRVFRLRADTAVAVPPHWISPPRGSLAYRGVDGGEGDVVFAEDVPLSGTALEPVAVALPALAPGVYRIVAELRAAGEVLNEQARPLVVTDRFFPRVATLGAFVDALAYIAYPDEMRWLRDAPNDASRRVRFDTFWGALMPDRRRAEEVVRRYYERVEAANRRFTTHEPGWKTDRGMVYLVLGPPEVVERTLEGEVWHYAYDQGDPARTFTFERAVGYGAVAFEQHVLVRSPVHEAAWRRAVERWRRGR